MPKFDENHSVSSDSEAYKKEKLTGWQHFRKACIYSYQGVQAAITELAFRQLLVLNLILIIVAFVLPFSMSIRMILIMASFLSWIVELFNTAIEATVDHISLAKHPLAKRAKDTASAAQMCALILIAVLWLLALWNVYMG